ncbi:hypothetical protein MKJ01_15975 [Chryseobacterium sp. SSA4.19]|uniref:hypothetical protein n=1 Tax=Chryseobacterium sp. SSA4.19 TaxID=2919915 RepID=UPI001F4E4EF4|nr:hypothetical protein [Chryseobacterium sp. SSA4.19]MCJ8155263.1 hypothetical protein [Chryseobacterium sp. SSA4.19]
MKLQKKYIQIEPSINPKIIGRSDLPLTVAIKDKNFVSQSSSYVVDFKRYFEDEDAAFTNLPDNIVGKMFQKKHPVDIMGIMPHHPVILCIVSQKVIDILEKLQVNKKEYKFKKLEITGIDTRYYFLITPIFKSSEYINFSKSQFTEVATGIDWGFPDYESYMLKTKSNKFVTKSICINPILQNNDIIRIQTVKTFFSERIINAFMKNEVVGYDIIKGGDFKIDLNFDTN